MSERGETDSAETQTESDSSHFKQIMPYKSFYQVRNCAESKFGLRRVLIQDLPHQDNLDGCYVGGKILDVVPSSSPGTGSMVFVEDDNNLVVEKLHGTLKISQELMDQLPSLKIDDQFMLFVGGASLEESCEDTETQYTQDTGKDVIVEGSGVHLWLVHPKIDDPKLYLKSSFGPNWWIRAIDKRKRRKRGQGAIQWRKRERLAESEGAGSSDPSSTGPALNTITDVNCGHEQEEEEKEGELSSKPGPLNVDGMHDREEKSPRSDQLNEITTVNSVKKGTSHVGDGEESSASDPGPSGIVSAATGVHLTEESFPDITDFPDSAFSGSQSLQPMDTKEREEGLEGTGGDKDSSDNGTSSSSWRDSESDSNSLPDMTWSPKKQPKTSYSYTKLGDIQPGLKKMHVIGVVKEFNEPRVTRGTEYCSVMTLVDETDPLVGVKCVVFNAKKERLPHVRREGDIICLHRVNTNEYRNVTQIEGPPYSSSLRFSPKVGRKMKPSTGSLSFSFTATERKRVRELRKWLQERRTGNAQKLEAIREGQKFNLLCQVIWIAHFASTDDTILSVWDGSVCPLVIKSFDTADADVHCDAGLNVVVGPQLQHQIIIKSALSPSLNLQPGSYVHISNVEASAQDEHGVTELCLDRNSQENITIISKNNSQYSELIEQLEAGHSLRMANIVATTVHKDIPYSWLKEVKEHKVEEAEPAKFHCRATVVRVLTPSIEEMIQLKCDRCGLFEPIPKSMKTELESGRCLDPCPRCSQADEGGSASQPPSTGPSSALESPSTLHCVLHVQVLLADHTGSLEVYIPHDEAEALFGEVSLTNFYQHQSARYQLMTKLYQLSGGNPPFSEEIGDKERPWIDCCLLKVREGEEVVCFIFDTNLK